MAQTQPRANGGFTRGHAFVLAAALCYGLVMFVVGVQVGRGGPGTPSEHQTADLQGDSLLASLTRPLSRVGTFDPDPIEAFMEVYEHLRGKYLEEITEADRKRLSYGAIKGMLRELGDPYTRFMAPEDYGSFREENTGHFKGIGAVLGVDQRTNKIQVIRVFRDNPAAKAGLKPGDYIIAVDGESTEDLSLEVTVNKIRGPEGTKVKLTVERPSQAQQNIDPELLKKLGRDPDQPRTDPAPVTGDTLDIEITRADVQVPIVESELIGSDLGYVYLHVFNEQSYSQLSAAIDELKRKGAKGLVLDVRDNPGGMLDEAVKVTSLFVREGAVVHVQERAKAAETLSVMPQYLRDPDTPVVVLVNHFSASASEILAGALQDHKRAQIVGDTTYGKGLVQTVVPLSDRSAVAITTAKYLTPNKRDINRRGIEPDVKVEYGLSADEERAALTSGKPRAEWDPQLIKAVEVLRQQVR